MAYTDDAVKAKLSALNETQESIVTVAQWVMFHRCVVRQQQLDEWTLANRPDDMPTVLPSSGSRKYAMQTPRNDST